MGPIIDVHCHIYPEKIAAKAMKATSTFYGDTHSNEDGLVDTLIEENKTAGICHSIVCSVATTPHQVHSINTFIAESVAKYPTRLTGFGTLYPQSPTLEEDLNEAIALGLKGFKFHPDIQQCPMNDPSFMKAFELCADKNLPVLVHTGDARYEYSNPEQILPVLKAFPNLVMIGGHLGAYMKWDTSPQKLCGQPNFFVDCSSSFFMLSNEKAVDIIRMYGSDHVLFGTDYPMWHPCREVERFLSLALTKEEQDNILYKNIQQLLSLEVSPL